MPTIAIVGRPNVGKSTIFNRLTGTRYAITSDIPGTTRDRVSKHFNCNGYQSVLVDTGGVEYGKKENIEADVQLQAELAIKEADVILFIIDSISELTVDDFTAAQILRKSKKPIVLVANKCDTPTIENLSYNLYELGFDAPVKVSAIHKHGIEELKSEIGKKLKKLKFKVKIQKSITEREDITQIAILGKPNAGKSSLVNGLLGSKRIIVSEIAGTTRDTTDTEVTFNEKKYNLIDTAGLRRRGKRSQGIEKYSSIRALGAVERSDIVILLIDGEKGITSQDPHVLQYALEAEKGLIIAINKSDLLEKEDQERIIGKLKRKFAFIPWASVIFISAKNRKNIFKIFELADSIMKERKKRIPTAKLNSFLQKITFKHPPASPKMKKPKFMYGTQADIQPPKFVIFFKNSANLHFSYARYLQNELRKEYGFNGTAIHLKLRNKENIRDKKLAS